MTSPLPATHAVTSIEQAAYSSMPAMRGAPPAGSRRDAATPTCFAPAAPLRHAFPFTPPFDAISIPARAACRADAGRGATQSPATAERARPSPRHFEDGGAAISDTSDWPLMILFKTTGISVRRFGRRVFSSAAAAALRAYRTLAHERAITSAFYIQSTFSSIYVQAPRRREFNIIIAQSPKVAIQKAHISLSSLEFHYIVANGSEHSIAPLMPSRPLTIVTLDQQQKDDSDDDMLFPAGLTMMPPHDLTESLLLSR